MEFKWFAEFGVLNNIYHTEVQLQTDQNQEDLLKMQQQLREKEAAFNRLQQQLRDSKDDNARLQEMNKSEIFILSVTNQQDSDNVNQILNMWKSSTIAVITVNHFEGLSRWPSLPFHSKGLQEENDKLKMNLQGKMYMFTFFRQKHVKAFIVN